MESFSEYVDAFNLKFINDGEVDEISTIIDIVDKLYVDSKKPRLKSLYNVREKELIKEMYIQSSQCKEYRLEKNGGSKL